MAQRKIVILLGPSNSGKDFLAETKFPLHKPLKLNESFKKLFALDHYIPYEWTNDKALRDTTLQRGPLAGQTISDAMVQCYQESLAPNIPSYGAKFAGITLATALWTITEEHCSYTITDLRKPSEALVLAEFVTKQLGYSLRTFVIESNKATPKASDESLKQVALILADYGPKFVIQNNY